MQDAESESDIESEPQFTTLDKKNLELDIEELKNIKTKLELDKNITDELSNKRYLALVDLHNKIEDINIENITLKKDIEILRGDKHEIRRKKRVKHQIELTDALNNRIYSDTDWKNYLNNMEPKLFTKLLRETDFIDDLSGGVRNYQNVETLQENNKKIRELYTKSYINLKKSGLINGWDYKRTEISRNWKNELKYMYTVNNYFMHELKKKEGMWSWILIVISSLVSVVSVMDLTDLITVIILQYSVTIFSVITSLIAAYIKKENYVERIKELDRYIQKVGKIVTSIEYIINQKPWNRQEYQNFKERFQNEVNALLSTPPPMSPSELKNTVYDLTKTHPENLKETYPWYKLKMYNTMPYYSMTEYGRDILESHWNDNLCRKFGIYICCTSKLEIRARELKKQAKEWFHDKNRDRGLENGFYAQRLPPPIGLTNRYKMKWKSCGYLKKPYRFFRPTRANNVCCCVLSSCTFICYVLWVPFIFIFFIFESTRMFLSPCFTPEYNHFLYPENYNLLKEREMKYRVMKEEDQILGNISEIDLRKIEENNYARKNNLTNMNSFEWDGNQISSYKLKLEQEKERNKMYEVRYLNALKELYKFKGKPKEHISVKIEDDSMNKKVNSTYNKQIKEITKEARKIKKKRKLQDKLKQKNINYKINEKKENTQYILDNINYGDNNEDISGNKDISNNIQESSDAFSSLDEISEEI